MAVDNRSVAARLLKKGDRVVHPSVGAATVTKVRKTDGAVFIKADDCGAEGTCDARMLSWEIAAVAGGVLK